MLQSYKGGWISVRANQVVVEQPDLVSSIQKIFGMDGCGSVSLGLSYQGAWKKTTSAIEQLMKALEILDDNFSQMLLEILVQIRRSIIESRKTSYEEFGI